MKRSLVLSSLVLLVCSAAYRAESASQKKVNEAAIMKVIKSDAEWKREPDARAVPRHAQEGHRAGLQRRILEHHDDGPYRLRLLRQPALRPKTKFDSGTGWPSFWTPVRSGPATVIEQDSSFFMSRTEILCRRATPTSATSSTTGRSRRDCGTA